MSKFLLILCLFTAVQIVSSEGIFFTLSALADEKRESSAISTNPVQCSEHKTDPSEPGYIILAVVCNPEIFSCTGFMDSVNDQCEGKQLIQHYCDPNAEKFFSSRSIECERGCKYKRGRGYCF